ncbi:serine--tRNA ligase [Paenibacillus sp. CC-CFT747]|nr:serine--tRNA ligase [Paenibacillus sp. CC-CFT747]
MLDIKWIRDNREKVQEAADRKRIRLKVEDLLEADRVKRLLQQETEGLRQERNRLSRDIGRLLAGRVEGRADEAESVAEEAKGRVGLIQDKLNVLQPKLQDAERRFGQLMALVPNVVSPDTPDGESDEDNVELRRVGEPPAFPFEAADHVALGERLGLLDLARGVKTGGSRSYYLKGAGVLLHRAVQQLAVDRLAAKGFTLLEVPVMVRTEAMRNTGYFPLGEEQTYQLAEEDKWLTGTSEVPLVSYYADEVVDLREPIRLAAVSACFRREVGSAGRDVHGLYRVHQFAKVEQVVLCQADPALSEGLLQEITGHAEEILQLLELPYRVMAVCAGDMAQKTYKQYDIETWMPSRGAYGETHSASNLHDFQARRSRIQYRGADGKLHFCHTLNNTAVASPRILIPLLEIHQQEDGSVRIPVALQPYMGGRKELRA